MTFYPVISLTTLTTLLLPAFPHSTTVVTSHWAPKTRNCNDITTPTRKETAMTPEGQASKATITRKAMRQEAEINMQKVGTREESEKKR